MEKKPEQLKQLDLEHRRINEEVIDLKNILVGWKRIRFNFQIYAADKNKIVYFFTK